jgi:threonine/homoserine/homoserine lactone efflux protein
MPGVHDLLLFLAAGVLLNITPGADTAFVVGQSLRRGANGGFAAALGIAAGCLVHTAAAALGLSAVLAASAVAFTVIKWIGVCYLCVIGLQMLLSRPGDQRADDGKPQGSLRSIFVQGFLTNALNPKVALFFLAFLPQFIDPNAAHKAAAFALLGLMFNGTGTLWLMTVAWATARTSGSLRGSRTVRLWLERSVGALLLALGARLALAEWL